VIAQSNWYRPGLLIDYTAERSIMADDRNSTESKPGEKEPGKFHCNPGNMSGKSVKTCEDVPEERHGSEPIASDEIRSADKAPVSMANPQGQTSRDRAQEARRKAEGIGNASESNPD